MERWAGAGRFAKLCSNICTIGVRDANLHPGAKSFAWIEQLILERAPPKAKDQKDNTNTRFPLQLPHTST